MNVCGRSALFFAISIYNYVGDVSLYVGCVGSLWVFVGFYVDFVELKGVSLVITYKTYEKYSKPT
jgi:hypothetical protein